MDMTVEKERYLEYCQYRKGLNRNTLKAYRIDLEQYLAYIKGDALQKVRIEQYITGLHMKYKQKTVKRKIDMLLRILITVTTLFFVTIAAVTNATS